jgi:hypothetical protein
MATTSSAGGGSSMANAQMGTRGLSAGDWVRLQRLRQSRTYAVSNQTTLANSVVGSNKDITSPPAAQMMYNQSGAINVFNVVGTSKIRRTASNWIDFVASQTADYVLPSQAKVNATSIQNTQTKLCSCTASAAITKIGVCTTCGYNRKRIN